MKPLNIFDNSSLHDFNDILNEVVYINKVPTKAVITTPEFKNPNEKYISTKTPIKCGDIVYYNSRYWLIISQSDVKRYESYKGKMRLVEYDIIFDLRQSNRITPPPKYLIKSPAIIVPTSDAVLASASAVSMQWIEAEIHVKVPLNETTQLLRYLGSKAGRILFGFLAWEILHVSYTEKGILDLTCQITTGKDGDKFAEDGTQDVSSLLAYVDTSMYMDSIEPNPNPTLKLPPATTLTDVALRAYSSNDDGTLYFTRDTNHDKYLGFAGYRVIVKNELMWGDSEVYNSIINDTSKEPYAVIGKGYGGDYGWNVEIRAIYTDGATTVEITGKVFDGDTEVETLPQYPPIW